jgi:hypothetical protein
VAGIRENARTFGDCHETEARVAALVGFNQMSQLRTFLISAPFLKYYLLYDTTDQWSHGMRITSALEQIRDVWLGGNAHKIFSISFENLERLRKNVPPGRKTALETSVVDKEAKDQYLAQILILMVEEFSLAIPTVSGEEQKKYADQLMGFKDKISSVPEIAGRLVTWPQMKFPKAQESDLERYNRAWNLLRHMHYTTGNVWSSRFEKGVWDRPNPVDPSYVPEFMRPKVKASAHQSAADIYRAKVPFPAKRVFMLGWVVHEKEHNLTQYLEAKPHLPFPDKTGIRGIGDPRCLDEHQYRDSIRQQLRCAENGLQLRAVSMRFPETRPDRDGDEYDLYQVRWDFLRRALEKDYGSDLVVVEVKLRVLEKESNERLLESIEPPVQLEDIAFGMEDSARANGVGRS